MVNEIIGFRIEGHTGRGVKGIKKNSNIPFIMRTIISKAVVSEDPFIVEIKLKPKFFKKDKNDSVKKLVISSASNLVLAIQNEMVKFGCVEGLDYSLEVLKDEC